MALAKNNEFSDQLLPEAEWFKNKYSEIQTLNDLIGSENQRGSPIPTLFGMMFKHIENPSTVNVETYRRMIDTDDTIGSGVDFLTSAMAARLGGYTHPSDEISKFVADSLEKVDGGMTDSIKEMLQATSAGFSVTEKVWSNEPDGTWIVRRLATMPPSSIRFEVDRTGVITDDGVLQYQRTAGSNMSGFTSNFGFSNRVDPFAKFGDLPFPVRISNPFQFLSVRIPRMKCIHYAFNAGGRYGNPYGRSLLRRAYKWWIMKDAFMRMMAVALDRKGTPITIVFADNNAMMEDSGERGSDGTFKKPVRADVAVKKAFENIHNDSVIILPGKKDEIYTVEPVATDSGTDVFLAAINKCDQGMMRAMLIPALVFTSGDGAGSFALGQEHAKTFDKIIDSYLAGFTHTLITQLIKELIAYNFPESAWKKDGFGKFGRRELTQDERQKEADMYEKAINFGAIDMNEMEDLNKIREALGFSKRDKPIERPELDDAGGGFGQDGGGEGDDDGE